VVEEGPHTYIERINLRGNTRTRDYVIRREFDVVEGDPYNRALVDRAERRLKNLGYFKTVKITTEPGSAPDRIIIDVDLEEQSTGEFSVAGGFSTSDGIIAEVSVGERNLLGTGRVAKTSVQYGQRSRGFELSYIEPYILDTRLALGFDVFAKQQTSSQYTTYLTRTVGGDVKTGIPITENFSTQLRYTIYQQEISLPSILDNCNNLDPNFLTTFPTPAAFAGGGYDSAWDHAGQPSQTNCYQDGEASLAVRKELAAGPVIASVVGYTLAYNTLDNNKGPTQGVLVEFKQDLAGVGGDVHNVKQTIDARLYNEIFPDIVGVLRGQAGYAVGFDGSIRMLDEFQAGPSLVRGFQPAGFGPRDITEIVYGYGGTQDALGGSLYWASSLEFQTPMPFVPKDFGMKLAFFSDAGLLWDYRGPTYWNQTGESMTIDANNIIRSSVGAGLIWDSPFGPLRFDFAYALTKGPYDKTQVFRFGGGTRF